MTVKAYGGDENDAIDFWENPQPVCLDTYGTEQQFATPKELLESGKIEDFQRVVKYLEHRLNS